MLCMAVKPSPYLYLTKAVFIQIDSFFIRIIQQRCDSSIGFMLATVLFLFTALWKYNSHTIQFTHLKWTIQWFLLNSQHCATVATISFQNISIPSRRNPIPTRKQSVTFPCPLAVGNTDEPPSRLFEFVYFTHFHVKVFATVLLFV